MEAKATLTGTSYHTRVQLGKHEVVFDEPEDKQGTDLGPQPTEMIAAALAACTTITLQMYARLKEWPLDSVIVTVNGEQEQGTAKLILQRNITLIGSLEDGQRDRLLGIANRCPVHRILSQGNEIVTQLL